MSTPTLTLRPDGTLPVYTLEHEWVEQYWVRRTIEDYPVKYDGMFVTREAAMAAALEIAVLVQPAMVKAGRVDQMGGVSLDWFAISRWLREHDRTIGQRVYETRAVNVRVVATENGAAIQWQHEDRARIVRQQPRSVIVDGVTFTAEPEIVTVAESPWFLRQNSKSYWTDNTIEDVTFSENVYVSASEVRFCGVGEVQS